MIVKVAVIGGGAIGVTSAVEIQKTLGSSACVTIFAKDFSPNTTSDVAAGLWEPYLLSNTPEDKLTKWAKDTQDFIIDLWKRGFAKEAGISLQPITTLTEEDNYRLPEWTKITLGCTELPKDYLDYLGKRNIKKFTGGFTFPGFVWEASKFLPFLQQQFLSNGGSIVQRTIKDFNELSDFDVVVNCIGLEARNLMNDQLVVPIRGQIARVRAPSQFSTIITDSFYVIPNIDCVILGGTKQVGDYNLEVCPDDGKRIFENCHKHIPSLKSSELIKWQVGLRPSRDQVKVALDEKCSKEKPILVHNYGHGGSGITLCVGCAKETASLVQMAIANLHGSKL